MRKTIDQQLSQVDKEGII